MCRPISSQRGVTIVELMIATAVFSIVLLIVSAGVISFTRQYFKGIASNNTQNTARAVVTEISQAIQFSAGDVQVLASNGQAEGYCINGKPYYYVIGRQLMGGDGTQANHVLVTGPGPCPSQAVDIASITTLGSGYRELLGKGMRLTNFVVTAPTISNPATIDLRVAYGDKETLCTPGASACASPAAGATRYPTTQNNQIRCTGQQGTQFCAVTALTTQVINRIAL